MLITGHNPVCKVFFWWDSPRLLLFYYKFAFLKDWSGFNLFFQMFCLITFQVLLYGSYFLAQLISFSVSLFPSFLSQNFSMWFLECDYSRALHSRPLLELSPWDSLREYWRSLKWGAGRHLSYSCEATFRDGQKIEPKPTNQPTKKFNKNPTLKDSIWLRKQKFRWQTLPSWLAKLGEKICRTVFKNKQSEHAFTCCRKSPFSWTSEEALFLCALRNNLFSHEKSLNLRTMPLT